MFIKNSLKRNEQVVFLYDRLKEFYYKKISDERLVKKKFREKIGRELNLDNPTSFNDKLQWLKLNWKDPLATQCADKYEVREFVKGQIGDVYLNELYGVYESTEEIDIERLPKSFVLKGTHGSGFNLICKDKDSVDWDGARIMMRRWLRKNYYWHKREWVYKNITPRIICEKYITEDNETSSLTDYKFFCFNGIVKYCQVIRGRGTQETIDFYDDNWNHMPFTGLRPLPNSNQTYRKPEKYEEMIDLAEKLSKPFPFVRVDFYYVNREIIFGELTFFPLSGFGSFYPVDWNRRIGDMLSLEHIETRNSCSSNNRYR